MKIKNIKGNPTTMTALIYLDMKFDTCQCAQLLLISFLTPSEGDGWLGASVASPSSISPKDCGISTAEEETACSEQRSITETVINGSMKETVSLTVDAKTETAVFKRFAKHIHTKIPSSTCYNWLNVMNSIFKTHHRTLEYFLWLWCINQSVLICVISVLFWFG